MCFVGPSLPPNPFRQDVKHVENIKIPFKKIPLAASSSEAKPCVPTGLLFCCWILSNELCSFPSSPEYIKWEFPRTVLRQNTCNSCFFSKIGSFHRYNMHIHAIIPRMKTWPKVLINSCQQMIQSLISFLKRQSFHWRVFHTNQVKFILNSKWNLHFQDSKLIFCCFFWISTNPCLRKKCGAHHLVPSWSTSKMAGISSCNSSNLLLADSKRSSSATLGTIW